MIERRYPIQTVLAERKMFAGGGAVLPQQMMPQQQQSGGILASSGPLLDAVAAGAINPDGDGGASLSEVQGFQNGGLLTSQDLPTYTRETFETQTGGPSDRPDSRFLPESGVTTDFSAQLTGATDEQLRQFISSVDPITQGYVLSQAQSELDRRNSLGALNTQPVNSLTPSYDFNDVSDNAEDQAEGFSGQDQDPGGYTMSGFSQGWDSDPKTDIQIPGIYEAPWDPALTTWTPEQTKAMINQASLSEAAENNSAAQTAAAVSMGIDSFDPDYMDESTTSQASISDTISEAQTEAAMDVGFDDSMDSTAGDPSEDSGEDSGDGTEDEGAAAADGGYFTSRMYNANAGQSGYPNMTAAEEIENGVQGFAHGGLHLNEYKEPPAYRPAPAYRQPNAVVPEQITQPEEVDVQSAIPLPLSNDEVYQSGSLIDTLTPVTDLYRGAAVAPETPIQLTPEYLIEESSAERLERLFPEEVRSAGSQSAARDLERQRERDKMSRAGAFGSKIMTKTRDILSDFFSERSQDIGAAVDAVTSDFDDELPRGMFGDPDDLSLDMIGRRRGVMELIQRRPDLKDSVIRATRGVLKAEAQSEGAPLNSEDFTQAIATEVFRENMEKSATVQDIDMRDPRYPEDDADNSAENYPRGPGPDSGDEYNASDYNFIYDRSGLESDDGLNEEGLIDESLIDERFPSENQAATTTADPTVNQDESAVGYDVMDQTAGDSEKAGGASFGRSSASVLENIEGDNQRGVVATAQMALAKAINDNSPDKTKSAMAAAVEEFNAAMPEYEGMSESEKGFAIMEAGLRIMAGKSSDALTNIAEGLKGLGPKFAKDAKEKRAWNRQVDLSAAKYGLEKIAKDAAEQRADAKAEGKLDSRVWILNKGESHPGLKPGEGMIPTVAQMRDSTFLGKFSTQDSMIEKLKVQAKKLKSQIDGMKQLVTDPSKFLATSKEFRKLSARVGTNMATKSLLNEAISLISKSKKATAYDKENGTNSILGIKGLWKDLALRIGNATGQKQFMIDAFGEAIQDKGKFNQFANGATTKHIEGLIMEGGKITEQERALGLELSGAIQKGFWSGVFTDKDRTLSKLTNFAESLDRDTESRFKTLQGIESDWINRYSDIGKLQADRLDSTRSRSYGTRLRKSREGMLVPRSASRKGSTEIFFSDVVLTDKDGAMTGLKENWDRTTR